MVTLQEKIIGYDKDNREEFNSSSTFAGFQMTFENGYTISVQFGFGNYCENRFQSRTACNDAEIAVFVKEGNCIKLPSFDNDVKGYCSMDEVANYIFEVKNLK
jgi:hypothetical protein